MEDRDRVSGLEKIASQAARKRTRSTRNGRERSTGSDLESSLSTRQPEPIPKAKDLPTPASHSGLSPLGNQGEERDRPPAQRPIVVDPRKLGTKDQDLALTLCHQIVRATPNCTEDAIRDAEAAINTVGDIAPRDALERLLVAQMVGVHNLAMEWMRRALLPNQTPEHAVAKVHCATKLLRTFTAQVEALNRHRGNVGHPMVVGNVNVSDGGQAIVGPVSQAGPKRTPAEPGSDKKDTKNIE